MKRAILIIIFLVPLFLSAQNFTINRGVPFIKNYTQDIYGAHEQNFDITQDSMGIMYFANFEAVLIFDGTDWFKIPTKSGMRVLSLDVNESGVVFVGGLFDFGYLERNVYGQFDYISLVDSTISQDYVDEIFSVLTIENSVYFVSKKRMFVYENSEVKIVEFSREAIDAFELNNKLYVFFQRDLAHEELNENGLTKFVNNKFEKITDNSSAQILDVQAVFRIKNQNETILGTESQGFFKLENDIISDFDIDIDKYFKKNSITCGTAISDSIFAIGTLTQGVIIVNSRGEIVQVINKQSSLKDEVINNIFIDASGNIWITTNNGISLIEINNALTAIFNEYSGVNGKINKIVNFKNQLYFGTDYGLYKFDESSIVKVSNFNIACWDILNLNDLLLLATPQGIYKLKNDILSPTSITDFSFCISAEKDNYYIGQPYNILIAKQKGDDFAVVDTITGFDGNVIKLVPFKNQLYAEVPSGKVYRINLNDNSVVKLNTGKEFVSLHINKINEDVFFSSEKGLFFDDPNVDSIVPYNLIHENQSSCKLWIYDIFPLKNNKYIFNDGSTKNIAFLIRKDSTFTVSQSEFLSINEFACRTVYYSNTGDKIWIGGNEGFIIFDTQREYKHKKSFGVFYSQIKNAKTDSLLKLHNSELLKLKSSENSLIFRYSTPYYPAKGKVYYRYFLNGFEQDTSDWSETNFREYTNLPAGTYSFYVEAKDQFGNILNGQSYDFKILVPLGRRWWMIILYVISVVVLVKFFIDWRMRIADKEKEQLELIIKERTEEIEKSKAEIEAQRDIEYAQRKEIMASIHYAKRIQQAVLPDQSLISSIFKDNYFILFRPYEVVSGDYFWLKELKNFVAVIAADCTGHGVPGAFMSMLGTSFLNEIVTRRSLDSAAEVLERLRSKVKTSLHQQGKQNEQKDGMDIAMYFIDKESLDLQYAGAYNPLYIVRKTSSLSPEKIKELEQNKRIKVYTDDDADPNYTLIELKANRQPIGIYIKEVPFENISLKMERGDVLYSFSDGYQDQFGGDTGEKYNSKRFKKLLLSIQDKTMKEQHLILEQNFIKWKGDLSQIDDVLVIGVKVDF